MASAVYRRIFDDVSMITSPEKWIRSSVFALSIFWRKYVRRFIVEPPNLSLCKYSNLRTRMLVVCMRERGVRRVVQRAARQVNPSSQLDF
jgi:hypothetical protein